MIELFSGKHVIYQINDIRLHYLREALQFFQDWYEETRIAKKQFISEKLWFDLNSMILGFCNMVRAKLQRFPGSVIKPCIINQDVVENHFCQLRAANGQNENPTYSLVESTQNSIIFGQTSFSKKSNTGHAKNYSFAELPKDKEITFSLFTQENNLILIFTVICKSLLQQDVNVNKRFN